MSKVATIHLAVTLDEEHAPAAIRWQADEAGNEGPQQASAMLLSLWDADARQALKIDLWTKAMTVEEMNDFFYQTFMTLAETYRNATGDEALMAEIKLFARDFAEKAIQASRERR
jgi:gliding motility-associated protein GldC